MCTLTHHCSEHEFCIAQPTQEDNHNDVFLEHRNRKVVQRRMTAECHTQSHEAAVAQSAVQNSLRMD